MIVEGQAHGSWLLQDHGGSPNATSPKGSPNKGSHGHGPTDQMEAWRDDLFEKEQQADAGTAYDTKAKGLDNWLEVTVQQLKFATMSCFGLAGNGRESRGASTKEPGVQRGSCEIGCRRKDSNGKFNFRAT